MIDLLTRNSIAEALKDGVVISKMEITISDGAKNGQTQEAKYLKGGK